MDNKEHPKPRRPLPVPGAQTTPARPNTPETNSPIPPSSFYGVQQPQQPQQPQPQHPPPLPSRTKNPGSSHTYFIPPSEAPRYGSPMVDNSPGFREPELITEENMPVLEDMVPDLIPQESTRLWSQNMGTTSYDSTGWEGNAEGWGNTSGFNNSTWTGGAFESMEYMNSSATRNTSKVPIDGRVQFEELNWWDPEERNKNGRPGPGILPPILAEELHDPDHSLFSVSVTPPNIGHHPTASKSEQPSINPPAASTSSTPATQPPLFTAPTDNEVFTSVPHPNAYYCPKDNGWVILSWKSSSVAPPLARSFEAYRYPPIPDQDHRKRTASCIDPDQPFGQTNKTHHFHKYEKAVDSHKLTPPFRQDDWESAETLKKRRRALTVINEIDVGKMHPDEMDTMDMETETEPEGRLLDLYICCQCSFYCVASGVIPGVISRKHFDEFVRDKKGNPPPGKSGEQAVVLAFETTLLAIENKLWRGENRVLKITRSSFSSKVGWNPNIKRVFEIIGFREQVSESNDHVLQPPNTEPSTPEGRQNRRKLLRAWLEMGAWLADYRRIYSAQLKDHRQYKLHVQIDSAREMYQTAIGAHPEQIPRGELSDTLFTAVRMLRDEWRSLGLTPTTFSPDLLTFGYLAQCRCNPRLTVEYFTHLSTIVNILQEYAPSAELQELLALERSRDRFTKHDVEKAAESLGFGSQGVLRVDLDDEVEDDFIESAYKECVKRSWRNHEHGSELHREANDAFKIIAEVRGSVHLKKVHETSRNTFMNPDRAYDTLEIPKDVDDAMLITVFSMRLDESPLQVEKMREALLVIAEVRDSERLRQFLSSGQDPGDIVTPTRPDLPRGLNQLGNTCYLNSLLQYFYTIKDLREAVLPMSKLDLKSLSDEKLTDDDLKRHRVGGRLVTRREIIRSKKFINQLAELFFQLEYSENPAVTPTIELAKLALVTSRDEEEDEADKGGTDSSNDTDATLVDDIVPSRPPALGSSHASQSQSSSPSVLGKRTRELESGENAMDIDSPRPLEEDEIMIISPTGSPVPQRRVAIPHTPEASSSKLKDDTETKVQDAAQSQKPPIPPRKRTEPSDSVMMFGKQHDVAECMDNCIFQIETALLKFDPVNDAQSESTDKTSVVKRLFYGKIRQRLTGVSEASNTRPSIHEKEDLFSHLPVNVADDGIDIYDGLSGYFDDVVEFEGRKARMEVTLVDLPPVLQIQLQRVQFNRDTLQPYKSQAYVKFGETIYMDRFMDTADPKKKARSKVIQGDLNECRDRLRLLVEGKDGSYLSSFEHSKAFLTLLDDEILADADEIPRQLDEEQARIREEMDHLRTRIDQLKDELEALWRDNIEVAYELTSVFIHRGSSPSWGHYFFYSRHLPRSPDSWFKYNDSDVTIVSRDEVLADTTGSTANPYLLVFARKGLDVVDTVKRFDASLFTDL